MIRHLISRFFGRSGIQHYKVISFSRSLQVIYSLFGGKNPTIHSFTFYVPQLLFYFSYYICSVRIFHFILSWIFTEIPQAIILLFPKVIFSPHLYIQNLSRDHQNIQCNSQSLLSSHSSLSWRPLQLPPKVEQASFKPVQKPTLVNHAMLASLVALQQPAFALLLSSTLKAAYLHALLEQQARRLLLEHPPLSMVMQRRTKESIWRIWEGLLKEASRCFEVGWVKVFELWGRIKGKKMIYAGQIFDRILYFLTLFKQSYFLQLVAYWSGIQRGMNEYEALWTSIKPSLDCESNFRIYLPLARSVFHFSTNF